MNFVFLCPADKCIVFLYAYSFIEVFRDEGNWALYLLQLEENANPFCFCLYLCLELSVTAHYKAYLFCLKTSVQWDIFIVSIAGCFMHNAFCQAFLFCYYFNIFHFTEFFFFLSRTQTECHVLKVNFCFAYAGQSNRFTWIRTSTGAYTYLFFCSPTALFICREGKERLV